MFDSYKPYDVNTILTTNDLSVKVIEIGSMKVKIFNGVVKTLTNVRNIPRSRINLISLGAFNTVGYDYSTKDGFKRGTLVTKNGEK